MVYKKGLSCFCERSPSSFQFKDSIFGPNSLDQGLMCKQFLASSSWLVELAVEVSSSTQPKPAKGTSCFLVLVRVCVSFGSFSCFKSFSWFFSFVFLFFLVCFVCATLQYLSTMSLSTWYTSHISAQIVHQLSTFISVKLITDNYLTWKEKNGGSGNWISHFL